MSSIGTKSTRPIFDSDFYKVQAILNSDKFAQLLAETHQGLAEKGHDFPSQGFKSVREYHAWVIKAHEDDIYFEGLIDNIIDAFGVKGNEAVRLGVNWFIFFGKKRAPIKFLYKGYRHKLNAEGNSAEVTFEVFPWTVAADLTPILAAAIELAQQEMTNLKPRNREWSTFDRDFKVYQLYLRADRDIKAGTKPDSNQESNSPEIVMTDYEEFQDIKRDYHAPNLDNSIRPIISRCREQLAELNIL